MGVNLSLLLALIINEKRKNSAAKIMNFNPKFTFLLCSVLFKVRMNVFLRVEIVWEQFSVFNFCHPILSLSGYYLRLQSNPILCRVVDLINTNMEHENRIINVCLNVLIRVTFYFGFLTAIAFSETNKQIMLKQSQTGGFIYNREQFRNIGRWRLIRGCSLIRWLRFTEVRLFEPLSTVRLEVEGTLIPGN